MTEFFAGITWNLTTILEILYYITSIIWAIGLVGGFVKTKNYKQQVEDLLVENGHLRAELEAKGVVVPPMVMTKPVSMGSILKEIFFMGK